MPKRTDANQKQIVSALRASGCTVAITSHVGHGFPDIVAGWRNLNVLIEIKDGTKPPSAQKLTEDEQKFHDSWKGQICIVRSVQEAIEIINKLSRINQVLRGTHS